MKMLKYLNKRIFVCLSLVVLFLIVASFVASSEDELRNVGIIDFDQDQRAQVTRDTTITFTWNITKTPSSYLTGADYYLVIQGPSKEVLNHTFKIEQKLNFSGKDSWEGSDERELGRYTSILKVPYDPSYIEFKGIEFGVVDTLLVIQKFNDINRNEKVDNKDVEIRGWEFKVTDPDRKTTNKFTDVDGEIVIVVPKRYAEKDYTIEEILQPGWKSILPKKQTVKVPVGKTTTVQFLNGISDTILIIRKFDDINQNNRIDGGDERLQGWEFKVTDPGGNTKPYTTTNKREIVINVPPEFAGKDYTVEEILKPGWKSILPIKQTVNVPKGETTTVQFLNAKTLLIIRKFDDTNRNSKIDGNDAKLKDWEFKVTDPSRRTTKHVTNTQGEIRIKVPGEYAGKEYIIEETLLVGWESVLPIKQPVKVPLGGTETVQFLNRKQNTTLIIQKFNDSNQNKELDSDDEVLSGWDFSVVDPAETTTTYTTDGDGTIEIEDVPEGDYKITEIIDAPDDWKLIKIATKAPIKEEGEQWIKIFVEEGKESIVQFLNNRSITRLRIQKFDDSNRNGEVDSEDEVLQGWNFTVTDPAGKPTTDITNNRGEIIIVVPEKYVNKDYTVEEELKTGWRAILPKKQTVKVPKDRTTTVQFLNFCETKLIIQKYQDSNRNNIIDNNDAIIRDWEFKVIDPDRNTKTYFTNIKGEIIIVVPKKYAEKEYTIEEKLKDGCKAITPTKQTRNVPEGKTTTVQFLNFCNTSKLTIHKFNDSNQNKVQDLEEQGLAWNFSITFPDGSTKRITTDANGSYTLQDIPVGRYEITEEPGSCLWASSTETTQKVDVTAGKEAIASFGNYIAECCMLPGRVWNNRDKNIEVCKSVNPCNVTLGKEAEVRVHLGLCVDPEHILNGTKVRNISVIDTLHNQFTIVEGSFSEDPNASWSNPDGTTTIRWNISSLCCEEWRVSFNVTVVFALPIDVTESYGVSKVIYDDPNIEDTKVVKELAIPAGKLLFVLPTPAPTPTTTSSPTPKPPGFEALLAIAGLLAVGYMMWRRKR